MMTLELPDNLRPLDEQLKQALQGFAPPANLDSKIVSHVSRRSRLRLVLPTSRIAKGAAALVAASLLAAVGYVADRQLNGGHSSGLFGDLSGLVAFNTKDREGKPSAYYLQDDIDFFPKDGDFKLRDEAEAQQALAKDGRSNAPTSRLDGVNTYEGPTTTNSGQVVLSDGDDRRGFRLEGDDSKKGKLMEQSGVESSGTLLVGDKFALDSTLETEGKHSLPTSPHFKPERTASREGQQGKGRDGSEVRGPRNAPPSFTVAQTGEDEKSSGGKPLPATDPGMPAPKPEAAPVPTEKPAAPVRQKVIRNGTVEFEVDSFDVSLMTITKLVVENSGFVASTDSAKLPNGKTRGAVTLRVPPERLDTFVLMLRGLGDLKSQKISAQDVSKQYTDIESQLRASRAMEERLLDMIKKGNGSIKDLLAAEKELGVWREKIEKFEGEIRYYDNLISMSTLTVVLQERDIKASAASIEVETVSAGVETDDVEQARSEILKAIDEAKGRIITSDLKKLDAGQFSATIVAEVAPDRSGPVIDRLKQLGKVARLDIDRKQTTVDGTAPPMPGARVEQQPTRLTISLYNLANVAPRLTTTATLASGDVEAAYRTIMTLVEEAGGRVVTSQLQRPQPDQVQATLQIEVPSAQAAGAQDAITALGEVISLQLSENPDTANVTTAKQGFTVRIISVAGVAARETITLQLASPDVVTAHQDLAGVAASLKAHVVQSNVTDGDGDNISAVLSLDLPRGALAEWDKARQAAGEVLTRSVVRSTDQHNTLDSKVRINLTFFPADRLPPRQITTAMLRVESSESQQQAFLAQAKNVGGRIIDQTMTRDANGRGSARVVLDVPRDKAGEILDDLRLAGEIWSMNTSTNLQAPEGALSRTRFDLQFSERESLVSAESGFWSSIKAGLATSLKGLGYSLRLLVVAVCLIAPWAAVLWGGWKLLLRRAKPTVPPTSTEA